MDGFYDRGRLGIEATFGDIFTIGDETEWVR